LNQIGSALRSLHAPDYKVFIGQWVKQRKALGYTQRDVAARLEKPSSYVGRIEIGERRVDLIEFVRMCEAIGISPIEFLTRLLPAIRKK
jgi:transcriptional regulator with XRE-family HTH domain